MSCTLPSRKCKSESVEIDIYNPGILLNLLLDRMHFDKDSQLARCLNMDRRLLRKIRAGQMNISGSMLMMMQEATGIPVAELRSMLKDRRKTSRMEYKPKRFG